MVLKEPSSSLSPPPLPASVSVTDSANRTVMGHPPKPLEGVSPRFRSPCIKYIFNGWLQSQLGNTRVRKIMLQKARGRAEAGARWAFSRRRPCKGGGGAHCALLFVFVYFVTLLT